MKYNLFAERAGRRWFWGCVAVTTARPVAKMARKLHGQPWSPKDSSQLLDSPTSVIRIQNRIDRYFKHGVIENLEIANWA
jgi:hypothetical protein